MTASTKTIAIAPLFALRWVDQVLALPVWARLPLILVVVSLYVFGVWLLTGDRNPVMVSLMVFSVVILEVAVFVVFARGSQADLATLNREDCIEDLKPTRLIVWADTLIAFGIGYVAITVLKEGRTPLVELSEWRRNIFFASIDAWIIINSLLGTYTFGFLARQARLYIKLARTLEVKLSNLRSIQALANPLLRYLALAALSSIFISLSLQILAEEVQEKLTYQVYLPMLLLFCLFALSAAWPILILRQRIRALKTKEVDRVRRAIYGDRSGLADSELGEPIQDFTVADLMYYEDRVGRIWEWPIQQHVQRLLFYLLIPPGAWVMGALVERTLDFYLG